MSAYRRVLLRGDQNHRRRRTGKLVDGASARPLRSVSGIASLRADDMRDDRLRRAAAITLLLALAAVSPGRAHAESNTFEQKATAAFALGRYAEAAQNYEKAFEVRAEPALLYNAAQNYRLAGNKPRALTLYQNYLRLYGGQEKRADIEALIEELKAAIENDKAVEKLPPPGIEQTGEGVAEPGGGSDAGTVLPPPETQLKDDKDAAGGIASRKTPRPVLRASAPADEAPLTRKPWFWGAVGGGVAVTAALILLLTLGGGARDPAASLGSVDGYR
jgi:tetratricopeptide (TPR) repeat protein